MLVFAFLAVLGLSYAVSVKMVREQTVAENTTVAEEETEEIISAGTDSDFKVEDESLEDIFASAKKIKLSDKTDLKTVCLNRFTIIDDSYEAMLTTLSVGDNIMLWEEAAEAFEKMYSDALDAGVNLIPIDGYCGFERQDRRYENKVKELIDEGKSKYEAELEASYYVLPSGHSEQFLGLSVAICDDDISFSETEEYEWLCLNAHNYGFIERYPEDKENITYINYEPWLWRYVGKKNAKAIYKQGLCLEEFVK